ncbi:hypothetical protein ACX27_07875 [Nostoc piscinale CENA21]|uniref:Uncharacterized protein n=1 Tax=Nostoc piscinale CENA21 TaxID=224013 RepID=A0A0M4SVZ9_9NOSO|nr:hypothetical protein [Nostoc piscinale]ALF52796.1 hypothetical protein ACX27_07875 [Nostoc piscinale CENA21]
MTYIDCKEQRDFTVKELTALLTGNAKPYPDSWYMNPQSIITKKNANFWNTIQDLTQEDLEECYSEFTCPLNKWEYLSLDLY